MLYFDYAIYETPASHESIKTVFEVVNNNIKKLLEDKFNRINVSYGECSFFNVKHVGHEIIELDNGDFLLELTFFGSDDVVGKLEYFLKDDTIMSARFNESRGSKTLGYYVLYITEKEGNLPF